ncbi:MAG: hypothetical protein NZ874_10035 [Fimbriimonadales bacterium]|nr:hypothetical protein [Fimbriimonadales bacterium]
MARTLLTLQRLDRDVQAARGTGFQPVRVARTVLSVPLLGHDCPSHLSGWASNPRGV